MDAGSFAAPLYSRVLVGFPREWHVSAVLVAGAGVDAAGIVAVAVVAVVVAENQMFAKM